MLLDDGVAPERLSGSMELKRAVDAFLHVL
jgi:hypothetical protein